MSSILYGWESGFENRKRSIDEKLISYFSAVLDFSLLQWLDPSQVTYPALFDEIKFGNSTYRNRDITALMTNSNQRPLASCMVDMIRVGFIDSTTIGCIASEIVLYVSLTVIIGVVLLRFIMAVIFAYFLSWKIGKYKKETYEQRQARSLEIEEWTADIYRPAPARYRPNVKAQKKSMLPTTSRFTKGGDLTKGSATPGANHRPDSKYGDYRKAGPPSLYGGKGMLGAGMRNSPPGSPGGASRSSSSLQGSVSFLSIFDFSC